jgi:hypothetical protein
MKRKKRNRIVPILILSSILIVAFILGIRIIRNRAFSYGYDQKLDYKYEFNTDFSHIQNIQLNNDRLDLSDLPTGFHSIFLEMNLKSTLKGYANEAEIKIIAGTDTLIQNLECRVKGIRYINISQFIQNEKSEIHFEFNGCKLQSNGIKLIAYQNIPTQNQKYLILAPHPDDAEIAAYGLYATFPNNTFIATVTAGDAGSMNYDEVYADSTVHYIKKGKIRAWNSITVPMLGGIAPENAINLGYFDAALKNMYTDTTARAKSKYINTTDITLFRSANCTHLPDSLVPQATWRSLVNDIKFLLLKVKPTVVLSTFPELDSHNDHKFTTIALLQAMNELQYDSCQLWLYTNHFPTYEFYPLGKLGSIVSVPPIVEGTSPYFDKLLSFSVSKPLQADKIIALDAMNDLRPDTQFRNTKASWLQTKKNFLDKLYLQESDYFRRSVRSNELFYIIEGENALKPEIQKKIVGEI